MTYRCKCHTEFCYICRTVWKTCTCPTWEDNYPNISPNNRQGDIVRLQKAVPKPKPAKLSNEAEANRLWTLQQTCKHEKTRKNPFTQACQVCFKDKKGHQCSKCQMKICDRCQSGTWSVVAATSAREREARGIGPRRD